MSQNQAAGLHQNNNNLFHLLHCCQISTLLLKCIFWDISHGAMIYMNIFVAYLLVQELLFDKNNFLKFFFCRLQCSFVVAANRNMNLIQTFHAQPWITRKRKRPVLTPDFIAKFHQCNQPHQNFLLHSFTCISQILTLYLPKWPKPEVPQKV